MNDLKTLKKNPAEAPRGIGDGFSGGAAERRWRREENLMRLGELNLREKE